MKQLKIIAYILLACLGIAAFIGIYYLYMFGIGSIITQDERIDASGFFLFAFIIMVVVLVVFAGVSLWRSRSNSRVSDDQSKPEHPKKTAGSLFGMMTLSDRIVSGLIVFVVVLLVYFILVG